LDVGGILCTDAPNDGHMAHGVSLILPAADLHQESMGREGETVSGGANANHAFYNSTSPLTNDAIDELAEDAVRHLELTPSDTACVSITLSHAFGIGSAAAACLSSGACISLPNVDGLHGCGVPSDRAAATLLALEDGATVLYADTHTLKALPSDVNLPQLRTGVCLCGNQPVRRVHRQFFTESFLGDDATVLAPSSGEEPASPRHRAGVASMA
jgi:hypothetical protein